MKEEILGTTAKSTKVIASKRDEGYSLGIQGRDNLGAVGCLGAATIQFGANADEMGQGDMMSGMGGLAWKVAEIWGDRAVDAECAD